MIFYIETNFRIVRERMESRKKGERICHISN